MKISEKLCRALVEILRRQNMLELYARVSMPNAPSERFRQALAFMRIFLQPNAGVKRGQWRDAACRIKTLSEHADALAPFKTFDLLACEGPVNP